MAHTLDEALSLGHGIERPFLCPVHGDSRPSASVNVTSGLWVCYTCGASGKAGSGGTYEIPLDALAELAAELGRSYSPTIYPESWLSIYDAGPVHPYWLSRFSEDAARQFRLGYDVGRDAVTYPFRDNNRHVLGVVRRPLGAEGGPKYVYPRGLKVSDYLFGYSADARRAVVLVEGALDAIACWEAGVTAFAIYGARLSERQVSLIRRTGAHAVICCFDNDEAGRRATEHAHELLPDMWVSAVDWSPYAVKDVAELPVWSRADLLRTALEKCGEDCSLPVCGSSGVSAQTSTSSKGAGMTRPSGWMPSRTTSGPGRLRIRRKS